jgi:hypothetical protein
MKSFRYTADKRHTSGLGLFELLVTVMILGTLSILAIGSLNSVRTDAMNITDLRNARTIIATQRQALVAGVFFSNETRDEIIQNLVLGVEANGIFKGRVFRLTGLTPDSLARASRFISMHDGSFEFDPLASQPAM